MMTTIKDLQLCAPTANDVEQVRLWRSECRHALRTPHLLTEEMQTDFYHSIVCNRHADSRWWSICDDGYLIGFGGLTGIQWENGLAEISLIINPEQQGIGYGGIALRLLLAEAFNNMGLSTVYGECYTCNPALGFWKSELTKLVCEGYGTWSINLPRRKRWQGMLHNALYFSIWQ